MKYVFWIYDKRDDHRLSDKKLIACEKCKIGGLLPDPNIKLKIRCPKCGSEENLKSLKRRITIRRNALERWRKRAPIRILRYGVDYERSKDSVYPYKWYFYDRYDGSRIDCHSGYEALFATYLNKKRIPFEFERWALVRSKKWMMFPDFYLPKTNEFLELKGRPNKEHEAIVRYLNNYGCKIEIMEWEKIRRTLKLPHKSYETYFRKAQSMNRRIEDMFADAEWP